MFITNIIKDYNIRDLALNSEINLDTYCIAGLPITKVSETEIISQIIKCSKNNDKIIINTPNINFFRLCSNDPEFYSCLIKSDILIPDGMPIIWIAKILGLPIRERIAGSSILSTIISELKQSSLKVFYFGGKEGIAKKAHKITNKITSSTKSVGFINPEFGNIEELSLDKFIKKINKVNPNILLVSLPAHKGVKWINNNIKKLSTNIAISSGSTINFISGELRRAPIFFQKNGLEWLWRIKQEPRLFKRYLYDLSWLIKYFFLKLIPLLIIKNLIPHRNKIEQKCISKNKKSFTEITLPNICKDNTALSLKELELESLTFNAENVSYINSRCIAELLLIKSKLEKGNKVFSIESKSFRFSLLSYLMGANRYLNGN